MSHLIGKDGSLIAAGALALVLAGVAGASPNPATDDGQHVATCAQEHLGQRADPPSVTCTHDGMEMTFATFGKMVQHMLEHHG